MDLAVTTSEGGTHKRPIGADVRIRVSGRDTAISTQLTTAIKAGLSVPTLLIIRDQQPNLRRNHANELIDR
jgi:hypothetical protein